MNDHFEDVFRFAIALSRTSKGSWSIGGINFAIHFFLARRSCRGLFHKASASMEGSHLYFRRA